MNALVDQVRDFLRGAHSRVTAKLIADEIGAAPLDVGKALDELRGLHHAACDGLNRWEITATGRMQLAANGGKTIIQRIVDAIGDGALTGPEIAERTGIDVGIIARNLRVSGKKYGLWCIGKRNKYGIWRLQSAPKTPATAGVDRAAIAAQHDKDEAQDLAKDSASVAGAAKPAADAQTAAANTTQVGGDHYRARAIQPWDYIAANDLGFFEGNIVKYVTRWREKGGIEDLHKARHYLDKLIEMKGAQA